MARITMCGSRGQAKLYADALKIRYTDSTNGDEIWFIDMGVKNSNGDYICEEALWQDSGILL